MLRKTIYFLCIVFTFSMCQSQRTKKTVTKRKATTVSKKSTTNKNSTKIVVDTTKTPTSNNNADLVIKPKTSKETKIGEVIYFNEGENKFLKEYEMNVTFRKLLTDSRCPQGTNCFWAGVATAEVEFMGTYTRPMRMNLSTMKDENKGLENFGAFNGYKITLVSVTPHPTAENDFNTMKGKYKIGIKIEKSSEKPNPTTQRGGIESK